MAFRIVIGGISFPIKPYLPASGEETASHITVTFDMIPPSVLASLRQADSSDITVLMDDRPPLTLNDVRIVRNSPISDSQTASDSPMDITVQFEKNAATETPQSEDEETE